MSASYEAMVARVAVDRARKFLAELEGLQVRETTPEGLFHFLGRSAGVIDGLIEVVEPPAQAGGGS